MALPQFEIVVSTNGAELSRRPLPPGEYIIGEETAADIVLQAPGVARRHARLTIESSAIYVEDLGSDAGTYVHGLPVKDKTRVWAAQAIQIGGATLEARGLPDPQRRSNHAEETVSAFVAQELVVEHTYEIEKILRREEEGAILDTHDSAIRRDLAMKVMSPGGSEAEVARFVEEAQITGQLEHPGIPPIHELNTDDQGRPFYTMKVVRGARLSKVLELLAHGQSEALARHPLRHLLTVLQRVCEAVAYAHSRGVIHGNLTPENISIGDLGEVLVMNWGAARRLTSSAADSSSAPVGTPAYMAPEQARGAGSTIDARSDVYALGAILYHVLALRAPLSQEDRTAALKLVAEGKTERLDLGQRLPHLPHQRIPDALAAIVTKAMATSPAERYARVEDLHADLLAYHNLEITEAEKVGPLRQFFFVVRRYKVVSLAAAIVVGVSLVFGTIAILESLRAKAEADRASRFVEGLKGKAPALLALAESEADAQNFAAALDHLDASVALNDAQPRAAWERAWALLGLERWADAAAALRAAQQRDPGGANLTPVFAAVEKMKSSASDPQRWKTDAAREIFRYVQTAGATGPALAFAEKIRANAEVRRQLIDQRLLASLGKDRYRLTVDAEGLVTLDLSNHALRTLDPIRGLPIDSLDLSGTPIADLEPLRGLRLHALNLARTKVVSLAPLQGKPLRKLILDETPVRDLTPLKGAPLDTLSLAGTKVYDLSILKGMPLRSLNLRNTATTNLNTLRGLPLEFLDLTSTFVADLSTLQNAPLKELAVRDCKKLTDFRPLLTLPALERIRCNAAPKDLAPLRQSRTLQTIDGDAFAGEGFQGERPVAAFWTEYDAHAGASSR